MTISGASFSDNATELVDVNVEIALVPEIGLYTLPDDPAGRVNVTELDDIVICCWVLEFQIGVSFHKIMPNCPLPNATTMLLLFVGIPDREYVTFPGVNVVALAEPSAKMVVRLWIAVAASLAVFVLSNRPQLALPAPSNIANG